MKNVHEKNGNAGTPLEVLSVDNACKKVLPLLSSHISIVRQQTEDAVMSMVSSFTAVSSNIKKMANSFERSSEFSDQQAIDDIAKIATGMQRIPATAKYEQQAIQNEFAKVWRSADDLRSIGERINLATVSGYLQLSDKSTAAAEEKEFIVKVLMRTMEMFDIAKNIGAQAESVAEKFERYSDSQAQRMASIEQQLAAIQSRLNQLERGRDAQKHALVAGMEKEIQKDIDSIMVAFQFQDRVCQIMDAVNKSINELTGSFGQARTNLATGDTGIDLPDLMKTIESYFVSTDQQTGSANTSANDGFILF